MWEKKKVLVIVKTAPYIIRSGREVVCTAGIDLSTGKWLRLYPIQFRNLSISKRYNKFQIIEAKVKFDKSDIGQRPDSYKIDQDSIRPLFRLNTANDWNEINKLFFPTVSKSLEEIYKEKDKTGISLGAFKPKKVTNFEIKKVQNDKQTRRQAVLQIDLFNPKTPLKIPPYDFIYTFYCNDSECRGHNSKFIAWEIKETSRKWIAIYGKDWKRKLKQRFFNFLFLERDTWFIVGTNAMSGKFMLIGYYSPHRTTIQESLLS